MYQDRQSGVFAIHSVATAEGHDADLVAGLVEGNALSWRLFHSQFDSLIQRCIAKVLRRFGQVVSTDDVGEVTAAFYVSLLSNDKRKLRSFDAALGSKLSSWIGMLATHAAYDHLRSVRREPGKEELSHATDVACSGPTPYDFACEQERAVLAAQTLQLFSDKDRAFAELYFAEGKDPAAIAEELQISVKTVYSKKHKIQSKLEALLGRSTAMAA